MSALSISGIVFLCVFFGALLGMFFRSFLPQHHLNQESKDLMKLGMGLIATMTALVLGLMTGSAKSSYDKQRSDLAIVSANVLLLDRVLSLYGPETKEARGVLRGSVVRVLDQMWPKDRSKSAKLELESSEGTDIFFGKLQGLVPQNDTQRLLQAKALSLAADIGQTRYLMFEQKEGSIPMPFLVVLIFWLTTLFISFGLAAPSNATVFVTLLICALSISAAIYMILELDQPFSGVIQVSSAPLRNALAHLGQ
jgi:hypothetical protein